MSIISRLAVLRDRICRSMLPRFIGKIRNLEPQEIEKDIDFAYDSCLRLIRPRQIVSEIRSLLEILENEMPKIMLEIGTATGGSLFLFSRHIEKHGTAISIDLPDGPGGGGYPSWKIPLYRSFFPKARCHLIRGDSHSKEVHEKVKAILSGRRLDFLFIDGDHTYEGVKLDFDKYSKLVKKGGIIALHDIKEHPPSWNVGVKRFWDEIKDDYEHKEFLDEEITAWGGIGVIFNRY